MGRLDVLTQIRAMALEAPRVLHDWLLDRDSLQMGDDPDPSTCLRCGFVFYHNGPPGEYREEIIWSELGRWPKKGEVTLSCKASVWAYERDAYRTHLVVPHRGASGGGGIVGRRNEYWTVHNQNGQKSLLLFALTLVCLEWYSHPAIDDVLGHLYTN